MSSIQKVVTNTQLAPWGTLLLPLRGGGQHPHCTVLRRYVLPKMIEHVLTDRGHPEPPFARDVRVCNDVASRSINVLSQRTTQSKNLGRVASRSEDNHGRDLNNLTPIWFLTFLSQEQPKYWERKKYPHREEDKV